MGDYVIDRFEYYREQGDVITSDCFFDEWVVDDYDVEKEEYEFLWLFRLINTHPEWKSEISHVGL